ncbi:MAG TPA: lysylphosphatidylglycerol synthase transmembrane domain-containing protein [Candidatus Moranbacteria bacterium]|jgi:hypothetical protein|nr:flippase-like domain-containing protein [Candidatus Moranbacteria bacterium]HPX94631.1 lysylphosphatidylglycerol synthase transmembrane domain-containing protein [Candidatus Moranbacteria bacterium]HQB59788.1 lysylphosphatidylglycerol synthase transmembrane domain-containing protein [Candidatus Moranbacteria bacterium]
MKNKLKFLLKLSISLAFVIWLVVNVDWNQVLFYLRRVSAEQLFLYVAVLLLGVVISVYKWKFLVDSKGFKNSFGRYFQLYLTGTFINNFLPSFIGGDTYRAYQIGNKEKRYLPAATSVMLDRITGLLGAVILSSLFAVLNWQTIIAHEALLISSVVVFASAIVLIFISIFALAGIKFPFVNKISDYLPEKVLKIAKDFGEYGSDKKILLGSVLLAIAFNLVGVAMANYILLWCLGINIGMLDYLSIVFLISIVSAIPVSINNIGIKEWAYITFFGFFGIASSGALVAALLSRIVQMLISFAALPYYLKNK